MSQPSWDSRIAGRLGAASDRLPPVSIVLPVLLVFSVFVLFVAPSGTPERLVPIVGTLGLFIECLYLTHLAFRIYHCLLNRTPASGRPRKAHASARWRQQLRRSMLPALYALIGFWVFALLFYPVAHEVTLASAAGSGVGALLWLLSVGAAIVGLAFGQLVSLMLDVIQQRQLAAEGRDAAN